MPRNVQVEKKQELICDECNKVEVLPILAKRTGWIEASITETNGLRLFEKVAKIKRYESFHIPNKEKKIYCSRVCILKNLTHSVDLFISEISKQTHKGLKRKPIEFTNN